MESEEVLRVVDEKSAKRAIEIFNAAIAIQDLVSNEEAKNVDILYLTKEEEERTLERVIVRVKDHTGAASLVGEFTGELSIPKPMSKRKERLEGTLA